MIQTKFNSSQKLRILSLVFVFSTFIFSGFIVAQLVTKKSPVAQFRDLLSYSEDQQRAFVIKQAPEIQSILSSKLDEYRNLPSAQREFKLVATELHFYLDPVLKSHENIDRTLFSQAPSHVQHYLNMAVEFWNGLSIPHRDLLLSKKAAVSYLISLSYKSGESQSYDPSKSEWDGLYSFLLMPSDQQKAFLDSVDVNPSGTINKILTAFENLDEEERKRCAHAFVCYLSFPPQLKKQLNDGLHSWAEKPPIERSLWREIAEKYPKITPIPLPPGMEVSPTAPLTYPPFPVDYQNPTTIWTPVPPLPPGYK